MASWTCPRCHRLFGRRNQSHECAPAMSLDEYFSTGPPWERPIFEAVLEFVESLGPVSVEPVSVGIFVKRSKSFVELRPMQKWVALSFPLERVVEHSRITRKVKVGTRTYHVVRLMDPADVDDDVRAWLAESFAVAE
jgi:Domain of unknown function (DUF5655)